MSIMLLYLDPERLPPERLDTLRQQAAPWRLVVCDEREQVEPLLPEIEVLAGWPPRELIGQMPRLRWFQQWGAGADWLMRAPEVARRDFILTNASGVHAIPISEHILALMLALARGLPRAARAQQAGAWLDIPGESLFELAGQTMLLVGLGAIGARTAQLATALGQRVIGLRRHPDRPVPGVEQVIGPEQLDATLPLADWLVLTAPLTPATRHLVNEATLARLRPSARLINIGRGGLVQEEALVAALQTGRLAGAGLDVFASEPLPPESPLWHMDNVIITGHYAGATPHYHDRALALFSENLRLFRRGLPLRNVVDKDLGY